jgi:uncharacterized OB-fold protein
MVHDILQQRVLPELDISNTAFWTGGQDGVLRIERCKRCGAYIHPPTGRCPACHSTDVAPTPVSGNGIVYSFTVNHQQWVPDQAPYIIVLVDLDEGVPDAPIRLTSNLVGTDAADVTIGMPVEVFFLHCDNVWLPQFHARRTA